LLTPVHSGFITAASLPRFRQRSGCQQYAIFPFRTRFFRFREKGVYNDLNSSDPMQAHIYKGYEVRYSPAASIIAIVLSSTNLSGVRYDVFNSNNNSVLNGLISIAGKAAAIALALGAKRR